MRHSLGTAVFAGMFGVTLFGIFLTPVFFYVLADSASRGCSRRRACALLAPRCATFCCLACRCCHPLMRKRAVRAPSARIAPSADTAKPGDQP